MPITLHATGLDIGHPAPERHQAHPLSLLFALLGAPTGWSAQLLFGFSSTSYFCTGQKGIAIPTWLIPAVIGSNLAAMAIAVAGLLVALALLRRTTHEHRQRSGGVLDAGEGRTRFLATWSALTSIVFFVATLANSFSLFLVSSCKI